MCHRNWPLIYYFLLIFIVPLLYSLLRLFVKNLKCYTVAGAGYSFIPLFLYFSGLYPALGPSEFITVLLSIAFTYLTNHGVGSAFLSCTSPFY